MTDQPFERIIDGLEIDFEHKDLRSSARITPAAALIVRQAIASYASKDLETVDNFVKAANFGLEPEEQVALTATIAFLAAHAFTDNDPAITEAFLSELEKTT